MKTLASHPGAGVFRSVSVIIIALICISLFLFYSRNLSRDAELIAQNRVLSDIEYSLAMALYEYTIKGKQKTLKKFDGINPFVFVAMYRTLPRNYHGTRQYVGEDEAYGWYYQTSKKRAVYLSLDKIKFQYKLEFREEALSNGKKGLGRLAMRRIKGAE